MGIGIGILLLVIGLIMLFAINEFPHRCRRWSSPPPSAGSS